ncbi:ABC transporter substrate-binding protein [Pseudomonas sp. S 311-6]|jgi:branched-chain amino acid transport system substrate-binding protein|uniref:Amino acid/amide ABC transporter substrate-binding protein (HAAT family) n=1 Tax=Kerstersia gyiorum TaxID=206506 RepID=A0A4Q7MXN8_9BURK|nr:ABC transporter substrate-binding protein [Kerstersia gyiorum]MCH4273058.1 ABC transporter substrate-binding protein [Kerstersia gyiorum]MCI1230225.1 ABC transporter substrate-binding protein [Kerstersia gyiorum]MCO7638414.1 ABC transporter substrate-binding protein [Pseudomonas sp. S 311-6]RZS73862.1 amino acid/amide ABC transporter substrate-binding protein (HAAT family) [Kerstersia gyiorum]
MGPTLALAALQAHAEKPLRIGEVNSYKAIPAFLEPYKLGWELAREEINARGGILGRPVEVIWRDDNANPGESVRAAQELLARERVEVLFGGFLSHTGLALTDFARQRKVFFLAAEPLTDKITWGNGNRYTFRLRPSTWMHVAALAPEAIALKKKRWAIVYPDYEYGQSAVATFKEMLRAAQPDVEFVAEIAAPLNKLDAGPVVQALADARPDAIFNVLFAADLTRFVREGNTRGLFEGRDVVSVLSGEPEYLEALGAETPKGWIVTGYPWYAIDTPENQAFVKAYQERFKQNPKVGSVVGYASLMSLAAGIEKAGSTDTEALIQAFRGLQLDSPYGPIEYRDLDHQSTLGVYIGTTDVENGEGVMRNIRYLDGATLQPSDDEVRKLRTAPR